MATASTVVGLGISPLSSPNKLNLSSGFLKSPVIARNPLKLRQTSGGKFKCFQRDWLRRDLNVIGFGLVGWIAPSSIPVINGNSLTGLFFSSISTELAHFPTGPALSSPFWEILFYTQAVAGVLAPGSLLDPYIWPNWVQGKD